MIELNQLEQDLMYLKLDKMFELLVNKIDEQKISNETIGFIKEMCEYEKYKSTIVQQTPLLK